MPPIDDLPGALFVPSRDEIRDRYARDVRLRNNDAVVVDGTKEFADASAFADAAVPIYFDAKTIGDFVADINKSGEALSRVLQAQGTDFLPAAGGSGFVEVSASVGGGLVQAGDEITDQATGFRYQCTATGIYVDGQLAPVVGVDTGPATNLAAGTILQWTAPRPGIQPLAPIVAQFDGSGLSGGRNKETDGEAYVRLVALRKNPPASGNDAEFQARTQETPTVTVQQGFTWPCIIGNGSIGVSLTLRPGTPGGNRIPTAGQLAAVLAFLSAKFPADDSILMITLVAVPTTLYFRATWAQSAAGWTDASPWPAYVTGDPVLVNAGATPTATTFRLTTATATTTPQPGQTVAFYDQPFGVFRRKRIKTVAVVVANKSWDIVCDTTNAASDISYTPVVGQPAGPWSDSLASLVSPVASYFDGLGPGEMVDPLPDPGLRKRRTPISPTSYASAITARIIAPLYELPAVGDVTLLSPASPHATPVGTPGITANLLTLGSMAVFA